LTQSKGNLNECVDFAENYSFMFQDAVQGYHWSNDQVILYPIAESPSKPKPISLCIVSDCMAHVTSTFYAFQKVVIQCIKTLDSNMRKIPHFSDGAASQYKNRKKFADLVNHKNDFGIAAEWHFFATSHGRSPCNACCMWHNKIAGRQSKSSMSL
jgi:hypothetical protein